jgi:polysaccharide export outer membrane protein
MKTKFIWLLLLSSSAYAATKTPGYILEDIYVENVYEHKCPEFEGIEFEKHEPVEEKKEIAYKIKPGDSFDIEMYVNSGTKAKATVSNMGTISYLFINDLYVAGMTVEEMRAALQTRLGVYYNETELMLTMTESQGSYFTVIGEVNSPGTRPLIGRVTAIDALAIAGGIKQWEFRELLEDLGDLDKTFLARNGEYVPVDFSRLVQGGDLREDIVLKDGDYIFVPAKEPYDIYVLGEVNRPGVIEYPDSMSLAEALSESGGLNYKSSSRVLVIRGSLCHPKQFLIDINRIIKGCAPNFWLRPGDIVYVPPRHLIAVEEIVKIGVRAFAASFASYAGQRWFERLVPASIGVIGNNGGNVINVNPVAPAVPVSGP